MALEVRGNREAATVDARTVLAIVGGFVAFAALAMLGLGVLFRFRVAAEAVDTRLSSFPVPEIQPNPTQDYLGFRRRQNEALSGYGWVDRKRTLIHVPVERAMALVAAKGAAAYDPPDPPPDPQTGIGTGQPPDGAPRAQPSLPASPYGSRP